MDIFTLDYNFKQGKVINDIKNVIWTERYNSNSEFKIVSENVQKTLKELPLNSYLSHSKTKEVMVVEDIEINKDSGSSPTIAVSGRSIEAVLLSSRITLPNMLPAQIGNTSDSSANQYILDPASSWHQAVSIIIDHLIDPNFPFWGKNAVDVISCYTTISGIESELLSRAIDPGILYDKVLELLQVSNAGLKTERPDPGFDKLDFVVHSGNDISNEVYFSSFVGDLESIAYFWSTREQKNASFVRGSTGTAYYIPNEGTAYEPTGQFLRWVYSDANGIEDRQDSSKPNEYQEQLNARAIEALAAKKKTVITQAKVSKETKFVYNRDYFIGDIVGVFGDYDTEQKMRVTEFSWSLEESKFEGYPSLSPVESV